MVNKTNPNLVLPTLLIQQIMKDKGLTSYALAQKMGMSQGGLYLRMTSKNPLLSSLQEIADALEVNLLDLFDIPADYHRYQPKNPACGYPTTTVTITTPDTTPDVDGSKSAGTNSESSPSAVTPTPNGDLSPRNSAPSPSSDPQTMFCPHCGTKFVVLPRTE